MKSVVFPLKKTVEFLESIATGWFTYSCSKKSAESSTPGDSAEWNLTTMYFSNICVPACGRSSYQNFTGRQGHQVVCGTHGNSTRMKNGFLRIFLRHGIFSGKL